MGYERANGQWSKTRAISLESPAVTKTATFTSPATELGDIVSLRLDLVVSAASGTTPTLDVAIQTSPDGTTWTAVASFAQKTAAASEHKLLSPLDRFVRYVATIAGTTPSFTYAITGEGR